MDENNRKKSPGSSFENNKAAESESDNQRQQQQQQQRQLAAHQSLLTDVLTEKLAQHQHEQDGDGEKIVWSDAEWVELERRLLELQ